MRFRQLVRARWLAVPAVLLGLQPPGSASEDVQPTATGRPVADEQALAAIAEDAYLYAYPLVLLDATARAGTNVAAPQGARAPMNQLARLDALPDARFTQVVMPNVDTLYTSAFVDLSPEPIVLHVPDTHGRYYLFPMLDAYTNVFASPGARTTGTKARDFVLTGPGFKGKVPDGMTEIKAPTNRVWLLGRTKVESKDDLPAAAAISREYSLTPLSAVGKTYAPPTDERVDPSVDMNTPPPTVVEAMGDREFFARAAELMKENPPPPRDAPALARFARLGLTAGRFDPSPEAIAAIDGVTQRAKQRIQEHAAKLGKNENGWMVDTNLGWYGTRYADRASVANVGLGANLAQDALYPLAHTDARGEPLTGSRRYVIHFAKGQEPPVKAFWSITMYGTNGYLVENRIARFAIGDRDPLKRYPDGSVDILVQNERPAGDMSANWLPAPAGPFELALRMYWPGPSLLNGSWQPPPITPSPP